VGALWRSITMKLAHVALTMVVIGVVTTLLSTLMAGPTALVAAITGALVAFVGCLLAIHSMD